MKRLLIIAGGLALIVITVLVALVMLSAPSVRERRDWKQNATANISLRVSDPTWSTSEIAQLAARGTNDISDSDGWFSPQLILMRNGEWLAYASICQKENRRIEDLFIGHGSDGCWYYSTYHFCIGMLALRMDEQPSDLASFTKNYYLRAFDGKSDECLQKTWLVKSK